MVMEVTLPSEAQADNQRLRHEPHDLRSLLGVLGRRCCETMPLSALAFGVAGDPLREEEGNDSVRVSHKSREN
jgi:hypothetical protein